MNSLLKAACWSGIAAAFLLFGSTQVHAQFRTGNGASGNQQTVNPNLLRSNFTRPVRQPMPTLTNMNRGAANQFQGLNQQGVNPYGVNPYGVNPYGMNPYGATPYGMNPYGVNPYGMNPYGMMNQGGYYPGYYGY